MILGMNYISKEIMFCPDDARKLGYYYGHRFRCESWKLGRICSYQVMYIACVICLQSKTNALTIVWSARRQTNAKDARKVTRLTSIDVVSNAP